MHRRFDDEHGEPVVAHLSALQGFRQHTVDRSAARQRCIGHHTHEPHRAAAINQTQIARGLASILNATMPIFTVLVAHWYTTDESITPGKLAGVVLGFIGVAVMLGGGLSGTLSGPPIAMVACLAAAVVYAFASVFGRLFKRLGVVPVQVAFGQLTASSVLMIPLVLLIDPLTGTILQAGHGK